MKINIKITRQGAMLPTYGRIGDAGADIYAFLKEPTTIQPGQTVVIPTGVAMWINDPAFVGLIVPRSKSGNKGLVLGNLTGVVDSNYQGELLISAWNRSSDPITIKDMDRIAQLLIVPVITAEWELVKQFNTTTIRGERGLGDDRLI